MCEALRVKSKLQWGNQDIRNAKNMENMPTKTEYKGWIETKKEAM